MDDPSMPADSPRRVRQVACSLLARHAYTVQRLRRVLVRKGLDEDVIDGVLFELAEGGLLDDAAYAKAFVSGYAEERGATRLRADLRSRGVARVDIEAAVADLPAEGEVAESLLGRHAGRFRGLDPQVARRRAAGFLRRRGFGADATHAAIRTVLGDPIDG